RKPAERDNRPGRSHRQATGFHNCSERHDQLYRLDPYLPVKAVSPIILCSSAASSGSIAGLHNKEISFYILSSDG
ncbi:hypothetical protein VSX64_25550, partial [Aurantimonas sp. C2-6-R+9]|uniref:hypothetical protein n=1 Tax=Aurantimonas sp. C2-6-R+9 TaxID=3114365 RepID=UPI002E171914|nr:hypothetical protein [Aurantimonas sp. C2-6-R+9]